jgi:hypothetical protein
MGTPACLCGCFAGMTSYGVTDPDPDADRTPHPRLPHAVPGVDLRTLPLSTLEAYVFSRIDGAMPENEIVVCTGLEPTVVAEALDRLASFGAITFSEAIPRRAVSQTQRRTAQGAETQAPPAPATPSRSPAGAPSSHAAAPQPSEAPRRSVAARSATPSPSSVRARSGFPMRTTAPPARPSSLGDFVGKPPARVTSRLAADEGPRVTTPPAGISTMPPPRVSGMPPSQPRVLTPVPTTYRPGSMRPEYGDTMRRYLDGARQAIAEGNAAAAANYYRLAQQIAPMDQAIGSALAACSSASAETRASNDRAVTLVLLGDNAARAKQWGVAAGAYEEAAALVGKDATVLYKLAGALYRSGGQLDRANKLVEESIAVSRNRVDPWLLLAQIRWESGARASAREALEEARRLRPDDERVTKLLIKFGSVP